MRTTKTTRNQKSKNRQRDARADHDQQVGRVDGSGELRVEADAGMAAGDDDVLAREIDSSNDIVCRGG